MTTEKPLMFCRSCIISVEALIILKCCFVQSCLNLHGEHSSFFLLRVQHSTSPSLKTRWMILGGSQGFMCPAAKDGWRQLNQVQIFENVRWTALSWYIQKPTQQPLSLCQFRPFMAPCPLLLSLPGLVLFLPLSIINVFSVLLITGHLGGSICHMWW